LRFLQNGAEVHFKSALLQYREVTQHVNGNYRRDIGLTAKSDYLSPEGRHPSWAIKTEDLSLKDFP